MADPLPEFEDPPVSEMVISVQFSPLAGWQGPYAGVFWGIVKGEYPKTQVVSPLPHNDENFEELVFQQQINLQLLKPDAQRYWFLSENGCELIQLQADKFIVNWRQVTGHEVYPRYEPVIRPRFIKEWTRFKKFVADNDLGEIQDLQCEVTYINDIIQGKGWNSFPDSMLLFSNWVPKGTTNFLPALETLGINSTYRMPANGGRLSFAIQHVRRQVDGKDAVQMRLVARGNPKSASDDDLLSWLDSARDWIVRGFTDLTSPLAHKLWRRTR